jgi:O-antigen/teichoic acid export membrane protein
MVARIADDRDAFKRVVENASHFLLIVGTGGALALLTASSATIHLLYGNAFAGATTNLAIMSLTLVPSFLVASLGNALFALRRERELVGYAIVAAASNIIGNLILIPRFGGPGSAFATLFAQTALLGYLMWVLKRAAKIRLVHNLPEIIVATIASIGIAVIGAIIGINGIITGALVLLTFMATLYALGESLVRGLWIEAQKLITHD